MKPSRFTEEQIVGILREHEVAKRLKSLKDENLRLKTLFAFATLILIAIHSLRWPRPSDICAGVNEEIHSMAATMRPPRRKSLHSPGQQLGLRRLAGSSCTKWPHSSCAWARVSIDRSSMPPHLRGLVHESLFKR